MCGVDGVSENRPLRCGTPSQRHANIVFRDCTPIALHAYISISPGNISDGTTFHVEQR